MQPIFEAMAARDRFNMNQVARSIESATGNPASLLRLQQFTSSLGTKVARHILLGVLRSVFLIELVKAPKIESTKFETRWAVRLGTVDPRHASYDECAAMLDQVITEVEASLNDASNRDLLAGMASLSQVPYEIPLDYLERRMADPIHRANNIVWLFGDLPKNTIKLRALLLDRLNNPHAPLFAAVYDKIAVKTYLTDRVLTGEHKTNREKRWETHPASVHFALRRSCLDIEYELISQICRFEGFPAALHQRLDTAGIPLVGDRPFRCPITLEPLSFAEFEREILSPTHGKSSFQVGHLNPLKALIDDPDVGHTAKNISWVSANGNRIQGSLSLAETRALIKRIASNYQGAGI